MFIYRGISKTLLKELTEYIKAAIIKTIIAKKFNAFKSLTPSLFLREESLYKAHKIRVKTIKI